MVTDQIVDLLDTMAGQLVLAIVLISVGVNAFQNPGNWALTNAPLVGQVTTVLPDLVHQALGVILAVAGLTRLGQATGAY